MLTKPDLFQIQKIVNVESKKTINQELKPIKEDVTHIRKDMKSVVNFF